MTTAAPDSLPAEARERARRVGISPDLMALALRAERGDRPFVVEYEDKTAGSFYRCTREGPSRVLYLNVAHPFFRTIYSPPGATARYQAAVETFLWVLGLAELDASPAGWRLYEQERHRWSRRLYTAAPLLDELLGYPQARDDEADEEADGD